MIAAAPASSRATASGCASSASRSSSGSAASGSTRPGSCPAASTSRCRRERATAILGRDPRGAGDRRSGRCDWFKRLLERFADEVAAFGNFPSLFMGLVGRGRRASSTTTAQLRVVDADGHRRRRRPRPARYRSYIGEAVEPWSYLKSPYYKPLGYPDGVYRVGPLARLNVADGWARRWPTRSWPSSGELGTGRPSARSTTTTPG